MSCVAIFADLYFMLRKDAFFLAEFDSIFKEQFKVTKTYESIVKALAGQSGSKEALTRRLKVKPGGGFSTYIQNLERADFVKVFSPLSIAGKGEKTRRIVLWDEWLRFYFTYVEPNRRTIQLNTKPGMFRRLAGRSFDSWCGLAFERLCMKNLPAILSHLGVGLDQVVGFGPFFRQPPRTGRGGQGIQIDILVHRDGRVLTLVECRFRSQPVGVSVIREVDRKIQLLKAPRQYSIERVLICAGDVTRELERQAYFHQIVGLESIFSSPL